MTGKLECSCSRNFSSTHTPTAQLAQVEPFPAPKRCDCRPYPVLQDAAPWLDGGKRFQDKLAFSSILPFSPLNAFAQAKQSS